MQGYPRTRRARLACFMHAASVNPEPGSNSPKKHVIEIRREDGFRSTCRRGPTPDRHPLRDASPEGLLRKVVSTLQMSRCVADGPGRTARLSPTVRRATLAFYGSRRAPSREPILIRRPAERRATAPRLPRRASLPVSRRAERRGGPRNVDATPGRPQNQLVDVPASQPWTRFAGRWL